MRMPHGGWARRIWPASAFVPSPTSSTWISVDVERLPNGNVAFVAGDFMDRGALRYFEIGR